MRPAKTPWIIQSEAREREVNKKWAKNDKRKTIRPRQKCVKVCKFDGDSFRWAQQKCRNRLAHTRAMTFSFFFCALPVAVNHVYLFTSSVCFFVCSLSTQWNGFSISLETAEKNGFLFLLWIFFLYFFIFWQSISGWIETIQFHYRHRNRNRLKLCHICRSTNSIDFQCFCFCSVCVDCLFIQSFDVFISAEAVISSISFLYENVSFLFVCTAEKKRNIFRRNEHNLLNFNWLRPPKCDRKQRIIS